METITKMRTYISAFLLMLLLLGGCASAPVQEMSDARQTIRTAYDAGAADYAAESLTEAEVLLEKATRALEQGDYSTAREYALTARERASVARDIALKRSAEGQ